MNITLETWQILTIIASIIGFMAGVVIKIVMTRLESSFNERRQAVNNERKSLHDRIVILEERAQAAAYDLLQFKAELPLNYVRNEDYIRNQTRLETKIDAVAKTLQDIYMKGMPNA